METTSDAQKSTSESGAVLLRLEILLHDIHISAYSFRQRVPRADHFD